MRASSKIFERAVKFRLIKKGLCLPYAPDAVIARYPRIAAGIRDLRVASFSTLTLERELTGLL